MKSELLHLQRFNWMEFCKKDWKPEQKFIVVYNDGDEIIISHKEFMECSHLSRVDAQSYLAITLGRIWI